MTLDVHIACPICGQSLVIIVADEDPSVGMFGWAAEDARGCKHAQKLLDMLWEDEYGDLDRVGDERLLMKDLHQRINNALQ